MQHHHTFSPLVAAPARTARDAERRHAGWIWLVFRFLGALAVLGVGAVHLEAYTGPYQAIPAIGTLFLLNFVAATVTGLVLLAPLEHAAGVGAGAAVALVTMAGMTLAGVSYVMLFISERMPLFGFQERAMSPPPSRRLAGSSWRRSRCSASPCYFGSPRAHRRAAGSERSTQ